MTRTVFFGFGAFVGALRGDSACDWWADVPSSHSWNPKLMVPVDLAKNPSAVRAGRIAIGDIQVDDHLVDGGSTSIGPLWPQGRTIGACWLSETYWQSLGAHKPPRHPGSAPGDAHDYELTSILYWDGPLKDRRFHGVHARIHDTNGTLSLVELFRRGAAKGGGPSIGQWWLELDKVAHPPGDQALPQIPFSKGQVGALYVDGATRTTLGISDPKVPRDHGA